MSNGDMRRRWQLILPVLGLLLFTGVSYQSLHGIPAANRYVYWASIPLDSDPLNRRTLPCEGGHGDCSWAPDSIWVDPGVLARSLLISALPAFVIGIAIAKEVGRLGVSELVTFMATIPLLIFAWDYALGWTIDRLMYKRQRNG